MHVQVHARTKLVSNPILERDWSMNTSYLAMASVLGLSLCWSVIFTYSSRLRAPAEYDNWTQTKKTVKDKA